MSPVGPFGHSMVLCCHWSISECLPNIDMDIKVDYNFFFFKTIIYFDIFLIECVSVITFLFIFMSADLSVS